MKTNILTLAITLTIGVILAGSLLMPVIEDTQKTIGENVTYTNTPLSSNPYHFDYVDEIELIATASTTPGIYYEYTLNGESISPVSDAVNVIISDGLSIQVGTSGQYQTLMPSDPFAASPSFSPSNDPLVTLTMSEGVWTITTGDTEYATGSYTWIVAIKEDGRYVAHNGSVTGAYCYESPKDFVMYGSTYTSGDLDTYYAYGNGKLSLGVAEYDAKLNWAATLVDGTTDIYQATTCDITVSDGENSETFTPYRCLYVYEVTGHAASGAAYSLLGALPIMVIIGLVLAATAAIVVKRDD